MARSDRVGLALASEPWHRSGPWPRHWPTWSAHEFKRWVGLAPMAYANQRRAERAAVLISGTDDSIGAIGRAVGWPEPASFSRHFRKAFGVNPREYRRRRNQRENP